MKPNASVRFFDEQFQRQLAEARTELNPFEQAALPHLQGRVLDYGCGLGHLAVAAARNGCSVVALDGSHAAIEHLRGLAGREALPILAQEAELRRHRVPGTFDAVVCIGLLMFFDCPTAYRKLEELQSHVRAGGVAAVNVLVEGTTYMDMFSPEGHCLFTPDDLPVRFQGWDLLSLRNEVFAAPAGTQKVFCTIVARKPGVAGAAG